MAKIKKEDNVQIGFSTKPQLYVYLRKSDLKILNSDMYYFESNNTNTSTNFFDEISISERKKQICFLNHICLMIMDSAECSYIGNRNSIISYFEKQLDKCDISLTSEIKQKVVAVMVAEVAKALSLGGMPGSKMIPSILKNGKEGESFKLTIQKPLREKLSHSLSSWIYADDLKTYIEALIREYLSKFFCEREQYVFMSLYERLNNACLKKKGIMFRSDYFNGIQDKNAWSKMIIFRPSHLIAFRAKENPELYVDYINGNYLVGYVLNMEEEDFNLTKQEQSEEVWKLVSYPIRTITDLSVIDEMDCDFTEQEKNKLQSIDEKEVPFLHMNPIPIEIKIEKSFEFVIALPKDLLDIENNKKFKDDKIIFTFHKFRLLHLLECLREEELCDYMLPSHSGALKEDSVELTNRCYDKSIFDVTW